MHVFEAGKKVNKRESIEKKEETARERNHINTSPDTQINEHYHVHKSFPLGYCSSDKAGQFTVRSDQISLRLPPNCLLGF